MKDKPHYQGHRERLKERFINSSIGTLPNYEIMELLLYFSNYHKDTKPLAKLLINKFRSFAKAISVTSNDLLQVEGVGLRTIAVFRVLQEASFRLIKADIKSKPILSSWLSLLNYCRASMGHFNIEELRILYLNKKYILIKDEALQSGTIDQVNMYTKEIAKEALFLGATSIILVHNHPRGNAQPSAADIESTKSLINAIEPLKIKIIDHIIITSNTHFSFKTQRII